jgi:hypothetical protein
MPAMIRVRRFTGLAAGGSSATSLPPENIMGLGWRCSFGSSNGSRKRREAVFPAFAGLGPAVSGAAAAGLLAAIARRRAAAM